MSNVKPANNKLPGDPKVSGAVAEKTPLGGASGFLRRCTAGVRGKAAVPLLAFSLLILSIVAGLAGLSSWPAFAQDEPALTASFLPDTGPAAHAGSGQVFAIRIQFSEDVAVSYRVLRDEVLQVNGGEVRKFHRVNGSASLWEVHAEPSSDGPVTLTLPATTDCDAADAVCTADGKPLSAPASITIPGPAPAATPTPEPTATAEPTATPEPTPAATPTPTATPEPTPPQIPLTAEFQGLPQAHDGAATFSFELRFSEEVAVGYQKVRDRVLAVTGGRVTSAVRIDKPSNMRWRIVIEPDSDEVVTVVLPVIADCDDQGAVCTEDDKPLSQAVSATISGPAALAPTGLSAVGSGDGPALSWTTPEADGDAITGYIIQRAEGKDDFADLVADTGSADTAYTDGTAVAGTIYRYRVAALRGTDRSGWSGEASVTLERTGLTVGTLSGDLLGYSESDGIGALRPDEISIEDTRFKVTSVAVWPSAPGLVLLITGGDAITDQALSQRNFPSLSHEHVLVVDTVEFSLDDATLAHSDPTEPGHPYEGAVAVTWSAGQATLTAGETVAFVLERRERPDPALLAPSGLTASETGDGVVLSWTAPASDSDVVTGYAIERADGDADFSQLAADTGSTDTTYTDATAAAGTTYRYRAAALRGTDRSQWSGEASVTLAEAVLPTVRWKELEEVWSATMTVGRYQQYENYGYIADTYGALDDDTLTWRSHDLTVTDLFHHSGTSTLYLSVTTGTFAGDRDWSGIDHSASDPAYLLRLGDRMLRVADSKVRWVSFVDINENYVADVSHKWAVDSLGWSDGDTVPVSIVRVEQIAAADLAPTGLGAAVTDNAITLGWNAPKEASNEVTGYRIERSEESGDFSVLTADSAAAETSHTDATVTAGNSYAYRVAALRGNELSVWSNDAPVTLEAAETITVPVNSLPEPQWVEVPQFAPRQVSDNNPAQGKPVINGTARVGQTLSVDRSAITDADGMPTASGAFSYEWLAILGAGDQRAVLYRILDSSGRPYTASTYRVRENDAGFVIAVRVSFEDNQNNEEMVLSDRTAPVPNPNVIAGKSIASLHSDNGTPRDIWSNGVTMWVLDQDDLKIYAYALGDDPATALTETLGSRVSGKDITLDNDNDLPLLLASDGSILWVYDGQDEVFAYALKDDPGTSTTESLGDTLSSKRLSGSDFLQGEPSLQGMWANRSGSKLWVLGAEDFDGVGALDASSGELIDGSSFIPFGLSTLVVSSLSHLWSNGPVMWTANEAGVARVVAFDRSSGQSRPGLDLPLGVGNTTVGGMTSDGDTMWVLDSNAPSGTGDYRIFAYQLPKQEKNLGDRGPLPLAHLSAIESNGGAIDLTVTWDRLVWLPEWIESPRFDFLACAQFDDFTCPVGPHSLRLSYFDTWTGIGAGHLFQVGTVDQPPPDATFRLRHMAPGASYRFRIEAHKVPGVQGLAYTTNFGESYKTSGTGPLREIIDVRTLPKPHGYEYSWLPKDMWMDGSTIWVTHSIGGSGKIYAYNRSDLSRDPSKDITIADASVDPPVGIRAEGLWSDGTTMWVVASDQRKVMAFDMTPTNFGARDPEKDIPLAAENYAPTGIYGSGSRIWVANRGRSDDLDGYRVFGYRHSHPDTRVPSGDGPLAVTAENAYLSGNYQPHGVELHGYHSRFYVVQPVGNRLWGYSQTHHPLVGNREPDSDFFLHHSNSYAWGIFLEYQNSETHDVLWVLDMSGKMFRYKFPQYR